MGSLGGGDKEGQGVTGMGELKGSEGGPHSKFKGEGVEGFSRSSEEKEAGGKRVRGKEVEATMEARKRQEAMEVEGGFT